MAEVERIAAVAARAQLLRDLHAGPGMLVLPNAWDAASARAFEAAGFAAIATTSGGVSASLGFMDHEGAPVDEMAAAAARIVASVSIPVSVDFEAGYQESPGSIVRHLVAIGAAGMNLEDSDHHSDEKLVNAEAQAERLAAVKAAARAAGVDLFLNARVDTFVQKLGTPDEQLREALRRARLYQQAGADCIYPITLADETMISEMIEAVGPINVNVRRGGPLGLDRLAALGVRRVTYASSLFRETMVFLDTIAKDLRGNVPNPVR
jgi:2-methylisocitrate lyase-like PEP mutase family enzyme